MPHKKAIFTTIQNQFNSDTNRTNQAIDHLATNYANKHGLQINNFWSNHGAKFESDFNKKFSSGHVAAISNPNLTDEQQLSVFETHMPTVI